MPDNSIVLATIPVNPVGYRIASCCQRLSLRHLNPGQPNLELRQVDDKLYIIGYDLQPKQADDIIRYLSGIIGGITEYYRRWGKDDIIRLVTEMQTNH